MQSFVDDFVDVDAGRFFPISDIKKVEYEDRAGIDAMVARKEPFLIANSKLLANSGVLERWRCLDYLSHGLRQVECTVMRSLGNNFFMHWDEAKTKNVRDFQAPTEKLEMSFEKFRQLITDNQSKANANESK